MIVLDEAELTEHIPNAIVTSGTFDGVHLGHQKILRGIRRQARASGGKSIVLTFWPHPRFILRSDHDKLKLLSTFREKTELIASLGIDYLIKIRFTQDFAKLSSEEFIQKILIDRIGTQKLVIGYDHHFGRNREGSFDYLKSREKHFGFEVQEIPRQHVDHVGVSSTAIRKALKQGDIAAARGFLGRSYALTGTVAAGGQLGSKIGFPTANIEVAENYKLVPGNGVYAVLLSIRGEQHQGMMNIGWRPTVGSEKHKMEVHIFDFNADIYQERVTIHFIDKVRDERKFDSLAALTKQLKLDKRVIKYRLETRKVGFHTEFI